MQTLTKQSSPIVEFDDESFELSGIDSKIEEFVMKSPLNMIMASSMWNGRLVNFLKSKNQQLSCYQLKQFPVTFYLFFCSRKVFGVIVSDLVVSFIYCFNQKK